MKPPAADGVGPLFALRSTAVRDRVHSVHTAFTRVAPRSPCLPALVDSRSTYSSTCSDQAAVRVPGQGAPVRVACLVRYDLNYYIGGHFAPLPTAPGFDFKLRLQGPAEATVYTSNVSKRYGVSTITEAHTTVWRFQLGFSVVGRAGAALGRAGTG
eukprot:63385-Prymnesium_polylepis.1